MHFSVWKEGLCSSLLTSFWHSSTRVRLSYPYHLFGPRGTTRHSDPYFMTRCTIALKMFSFGLVVFIFSYISWKYFSQHMISCFLNSIMAHSFQFMSHWLIYSRLGFGSCQHLDIVFLSFVEKSELFL